MHTVIRFLALIAFLFAANPTRAQLPWPGNIMTSVYESPVLEFRSQITAFHHKTADAFEYVSFEGNLVNTGTQWADPADALMSTFIVKSTDKTIVTAIYTAMTTGRKFNIQYTRDQSTFAPQRRVMWIRTFNLLN